jgi:hypothetical protein
MIDVATVTKVLLLDGWHEVANASFMVELFEFGVLGSSIIQYVTPNYGFTFWESGTDRKLTGPLSAILTVQTDPTMVST